MRFSHYLRRQLITKILNDIPEPQSIQKELASIAQAEAYETLPKKIKDIFDDPELKPYLEKRYIYIGITSVLIIYKPGYQPSKKIIEAAGAIEKRSAKINISKTLLRHSIEKELNDCTTFKTAREKLPFLAGYFQDSDSDLSAYANTTYSIAGESPILQQLRELGWRGQKAPEVVEATEAAPVLVT